MDPKDNTTIPSTNNQDQPTDQQRADGELVVSHEAELDTDSTNQTVPTASTTPGANPTTTTDDNGDLDLSLGLGAETPATPPPAPADPAAPVTPVSPLGDQPAPPLQPFSGDLATDTATPPPAQPDAAQPFPAATPDPTASVTPGVVTPSAPVDSSAPAAPLTDSTVPAGITEPKNKAMVLGLVLLAAVIIAGLGIYAFVAM